VETDRSLGSGLRLSRLVARLSQQALAQRAEVSVSTICRIEKGYVDPRSETVDRIFLALAAANKREAGTE